MTCIVGITDGKTVFIGGDSAGVSSNYAVVVRKDSKVGKRGEFIFGFTSSFRMGQILLHRFNPPEIPESQDLMAYMVGKFVDELRESFRSHGFAENNSGKEVGGTFLVGIRGRLFGIESDYQVTESLCGFDAVGCGSEIAKGSLYSSGIALVSYEGRIYEALRAAETFSGGVRAPFNIVRTDTV